MQPYVNALSIILTFDVGDSEIFRNIPHGLDRGCTRCWARWWYRCYVAEVSKVTGLNAIPAEDHKHRGLNPKIYITRSASAMIKVLSTTSHQRLLKFLQILLKILMRNDVK